MRHMHLYTAYSKVGRANTPEFIRAPGNFLPLVAKVDVVSCSRVCVLLCKHIRMQRIHTPLNTLRAFLRVLVLVAGEGLSEITRVQVNM